MSQVIYYARIALVLLVICCWSTQATLAQIAPTNSATISGSVSDLAGNPIAHAKVSLSGPKSTSTQTDAHGLFVFVGVPFGTYQISTAAVGLGTATKSVSVQGDVDVAIHYEPASMNGLKVIANVSSSANAQFNVTPASITQVNPIENAFAGKTSWRTILEQIPGVAQAGLGRGNEVYAALPDGPFVPMQISINGALPYETAVLLDDMPLISGSSVFNAAGAGTDVGHYPLNGFSAADVIRGPGANAPSIVDSIGGSFVLHSPGVINQDNYDFSLSTDPYGGIVANALAAVRWKKLSAVVTYGINDSPGPFHGAELNYNIPSTVNGATFSPYMPPCAAPCYFGSYLADLNYAPLFAGIYGYQSGFAESGVNYSTAWSQHNGSLALTYALSSSIVAELFYAGSSSMSDGVLTGNTLNFLPPAGYTGAVPTGQNFLPSGAPGLGFQQNSDLLEEKITAKIGNGELRLAALQNRTFAQNGGTFPGSATLQLYGAGYLNGSSTPTFFNGGSYNVVYSPLSTYCSFSGWSNNRDLLLNYTTPLGENLHAGASFVKSYYDAPSNDQIMGPFVYLASIPSAISQTTNELRVFVGGNPSEKTSLDLSMYFANADYHVPDPSNQAINTSNYTNATYVDSRYSYAAPRMGFVWRPTAVVAVRASAGGGFAEAPLGDLVIQNELCPSSSTTCSVGLNNLNLQPEKSFGFDLGTDIRMHRNTVLSFDVYRTNLYGQLYQSTTYRGIGTCPGNTTAPCYATQYGNLGVSRDQGILVDLRHDVPHGLYWTISGGLTRGYVVSLPAGFYNTSGGTCNPATGANCTNLNVVPNVNFNGTFTGVSVPYSQGLGMFGYRWNPQKYIDLVATYYGNNNTYFRPAFVELDGNVGYSLTKNVSLLMTFRNITGIYDSQVQIYSPANFSGASTISGLPAILYGEQYGPRTVLLTMNLHS